MIVILFNDDMVFVYPQRLPAAWGAWCDGLDRMARWDEILPGLLESSQDIIWMAGAWASGRAGVKYLVPVAREHMQAVVDGDLAGIRATLRDAFMSLPSRCPICLGQIRLLWPTPIGPDSMPTRMVCRRQSPCWGTDLPELALLRLKDLQ